ncbi:hypothetical protein ACXYMX_04215 [Sporosarcina sp. CAU 1771]
MYEEINGTAVRIGSNGIPADFYRKLSVLEKRPAKFPLKASDLPDMFE